MQLISSSIEMIWYRLMWVFLQVNFRIQFKLWDLHVISVWQSFSYLIKMIIIFNIYRTPQKLWGEESLVCRKTLLQVMTHLKILGYTMFLITFNLRLPSNCAGANKLLGGLVFGQSLFMSYLSSVLLNMILLYIF